MVKGLKDKEASSNLSLVPEIQNPKPKTQNQKK